MKSRLPPPKPDPTQPPYAPVFSTAGLRRVEEQAHALLQKSDPLPTLMERAGLAAAELARSLLDDRGRRILILAGPGNNGGDAFEVAARLQGWFYRVTLVFAGDPAKLPADAARAREKWLTARGAEEKSIPEGESWDLIVDGLFGLGLTRPLAGPQAQLVERINAMATSARIPVLALDIPSGIASDTGTVMGVAVRATHTITFIALKPGLLTLDGPDYCGEVQCASLGINMAAHASDGALLDERVRDSLAPRPRNFHKGKAGNVIVIGGATGMLGAVILAARAALKSGAGRVYAALLSDLPAFDPAQAELMFRSPRGALQEDGVALVGPGMGREKAAATLLKTVLGLDRTLVLDADALNLIADSAPLAALLAKRKAPTLLTPHPAEAARLLKQSTAAVQADRIAAALKLADRFQSLVVLKGNGSIIARPATKGKAQHEAAAGPRWWINPTGNPGMASAGMGDTLGGLLASFLAQGVEPLPALQLAVWLHGAAADELVARGEGPLGITASEVTDAARAILNRPAPAL